MVYYVLKKSFMVLVMFAFLCVPLPGICSAEDKLLCSGIYMEDVVKRYNDLITKEYENDYKGFGKECFSANRVLLAEYPAGEMWGYAIGPKGDQMLRFYASLKHEVYGVDVLLHKNSFLMLSAYKDNNPQIISMLVECVFRAAGCWENIDEAEKEKVHNKLLDLKYFTYDKEEFRFFNDKKKYYVEKSYDQRTNHMKVAIYVE